MMRAADSTLADYYARRAAEYERVYLKPERQADLRTLTEILSIAFAGQDVLEVACGTGYWTRVMAATAHSLIALDNEPEMLRIARAKEFPIRVDFVRADMFTYPLRDTSFDVVALGFWFSHQPRREFDRLFDLLVRPLRPAGLIWMIDNNPPAEGSQHYTVGRDEQGNNFKRRFLHDGRDYVILKNYFERHELEQILRPRFRIESLVYGHRYWSVVLGVK